ncbi:unnamed protein product [Brugia timori]|uniref:Transposase n=1 Tax=Brugia timori TaxID=42155 RepID=A0A0R3QRY2_9BILA|nr:unnamed protein product [Brugia timori]
MTDIAKQPKTLQLNILIRYAMFPDNVGPEEYRKHMRGKITKEKMLMKILQVLRK